MPQKPRTEGRPHHVRIENCVGLYVPLLEGFLCRRKAKHTSLARGSPKRYLFGEALASTLLNATVSVATIPWRFTYLCWNIPIRARIVLNAKANWNGSTIDRARANVLPGFVPKRTKWRKCHFEGRHN